MQIVRGGVLAAALCALALGASSGAFAQATTSTTTNVSNFEIISVDGNYLVVRDQAGTRELTVPSDFRFNVDGKSLAVGDLKAGMKGTATITKTTTVRPVVVTEIKKGKVISQTGKSVVIEQDNGKIHRFSQSEVDTRGIQLFMGDKPVRLFNLEPGDQISAKIVTAGPPEVLTKQQVDAILAQPPAPVAAAAPPAEEPAASTPEAAPEAEPVAEAAPEVVAEAAPAPARTDGSDRARRGKEQPLALDPAVDCPVGRGLAGHAQQKTETELEERDHSLNRRGSWAGSSPRIPAFVIRRQAPS